MIRVPFEVVPYDLIARYRRVVYSNRFATKVNIESPVRVPWRVGVWKRSGFSTK
jgi:hypothetical protein